MPHTNMGISVRNCEECETMNCAIRVMRTLQFMRSNGTGRLEYEVNFRTGVAFDRETEEIVINEELLMQAIMMANPGQKKKKLRLISEEEFYSKYRKIPPIVFTDDDSDVLP